MSKIRNFDGGDRSDIAEPLPPLIRLLRGHIVGTAEYVTPSPRPATIRLVHIDRFEDNQVRATG
jgi:hypothetical protein